MALPSSRFQRQPKPAEPTKPADESERSAQGPGANVGLGSHDEAALKALQERLSKVQERRMRRQIELDRVTKELAACEQQAKALGVDSLEALEAKVRELEELDAQAMQEFLTNLEKEEAKLDAIDKQLAELDKDLDA